jgi:hypothetical protein
VKKTIRKWTAAWAAVAFTWMVVGLVSPSQLRAETAKTENTASTVEAAKSDNSENNSFEKEGTIPEIAKKKKSPWPYIIAGALVVGIVVYFTLIKKTKHILIVEMGTGATGFPGAGKYIYKKGEKVAYNFTCADGYKNLIIFLDEKVVAASGTVVMDKAHSLRVEATKLSDYHLTVSYMDDAITGSPARGTYQYREGTTVSYHYAVADLALAAKLDGIPVSLPGSLIMDKNHALEVSFGPPPDVRGIWRFKLKKQDSNSYFPRLDISFSGTKTSGESKVIKDPAIPSWCEFWGGTGTYTISSNQVEMEVEEYNAGLYYSGYFTSSKTMEGIYEVVYWMDPVPARGKSTFAATRIE